MTVRTGRFSLLAAAIAFAIGLAIPASAQVFTGRIDITVHDSTGAVLPGVTVDISGPETHESVTDSLGEAHFLNLAVGTYTVKAALQGFGTYTNNNVVVQAANPVVLPVQMAVAGVKAAVQVTAEAPIISPKKTTVGSTISNQELQQIPTARDPWVILQTVPTIITDRVNVGGSESGQQSGYISKGASETDNTWNLDGIPITDMGATGSSPTYFDFDAFQEMQVTTGGSDAQVATPGAQLNLVLKSGGNTPHGEGHYYFENQGLQATNLPSDLAATLGGASGNGNRINQDQDRGFDLGGPLVKDKLWAWGSYGRTNIDNLTLIGSHDKTELENYAFKLTDQLTQNIRPQFTYFRGNKVKNGRNASPDFPPETTWDQTGPTSVYEGQVNFVLGSNVFLTARGAHITSGFSLTPEGGLTTPMYQDVNGVNHGSYVYYSTTRPQDTALVDGNYFKGKHEVKFGFSWRRATVTSTSVWPGNNTLTYDVNPATNDGYDLLGIVFRPYNPKVEAKYYSAYAGDTISLSRLTLNLAVRYDRNSGEALATSEPAAANLSNYLPAITAPAAPGPEWSLVSPRVGVTYALDESHKTLARASYSMFMSQMGATGGEAGVLSAAPYSYAYVYANDTNGNHVLDPSEAAAGLFLGGAGFNVNNPTQIQTYNQIASNLVAPRTHEVVLGLDRELMPDFGVSGTFTYRRYNDVLWQPSSALGPLIGVTSADYYVDGTLTGTAVPIGSYTQNYYALTASDVPPGSGRVLENHPGYHQTYMSFEIEATKRMSNHWMGRFGFSTNSDKEYFDNPSVAIQDPTPLVDDPKINGGDVVVSAAGSGKTGIYLVLPKYQVNMDGLYEGPWGLNFGGNLLVRQGYAEPFEYRVNTDDPVTTTKDVLLTSSVDQYRLPAVVLLNARVEKTVKLGRSNLTFSLDAFNLFNEATVLQRQFRLDTGSAANSVLAIMNPRIARLGIRITF
jgi:Carboxypeptidase regulatory-like domain/TonB-dependent Receptor Plug Domain